MKQVSEHNLPARRDGGLAENTFLAGIPATNESSLPRPSLSLSTYVSIIVRFRFLILVLTLLCGAVGIVASHDQPKTYSATARVFVGSYLPPLNGDIAAILRDETTRADYVKNMMPFLESYSIGNKVLIENPDIYLYFSGGKPSPSLDQLPSREDDVPPDIPMAPENVDFPIDMADKRLAEEARKTHEKLRRMSPPIQLLPLDIVESYLGTLSAVRMKDSTIVSITATTGDSQMAARIANAHTNAFMQLVQAKRLQTANSVLDFLQERVKDAKSDYSDKHRRLVEFSKAHSLMVEEEMQKTMLGEASRSIDIQLSQARMMKVETEAELSNLTGGSIRDTSASFNVDTYAVMLGKRARFNEMKKYFRKGSPALRELEFEIKTLNETMQLGVQKRRTDAALASRVASDRLSYLERTKERMIQDEGEKSKLLTEYRTLKDERDAAHTLAGTLLRRIDDALVSAETDQKNVYILDSALPSNRPVGVPRGFNFLIACFFGPVVGVALAFFLNFLDDTVRTIEDLQQTVPLPVIGIIPSFEALPEDLDFAESFPDLSTTASEEKEPDYGALPEESSVKQDTESRALFPDTPRMPEHIHPPPEITPAASHVERERDRATEVLHPNETAPTNGHVGGTLVIRHESVVVVSAPLSAESEAFRNLRTSVRYSGIENPPKILLVTSGQKEEGKSTIAVNLAASFANSGERTLLLDADLRLPVIHKLFGIPRELDGLADYLGGNADYHQLISETSIANLLVLPAGRPTGMPVELLESRRMLELLQLLTDEFDRIIIDSPPIVGLTDSTVLSRYVDGVLVVVRSAFTPKGVVEQAIARLQQMRADILGFVLNDVSKATAGKDATYYYSN